MGSGYGKLACFVRVAPVVVLAAGTDIQAAPSTRSVLSRAAAYVESQVDLLPQLVAEERSTQTLRPHTVGTTTRQQTLVADFAWVRLEGTTETLGVREVREVNGQRVASAGRLDQLLRGRTAGQYSELLAENARYNLKPGSRNLNLPTMAMLLLHRDVQPRFKWKQEKASGQAEMILSFKERERPTVIRGTNNEPVFSYGRIWLDSATGAVNRTELHADVDRAKYVLVVEFSVDPFLRVLLPLRLRERYSTPEDILEGFAEYTNYRRFQTEGRLVR